MRKSICTMLAGIMFMVGCGGREANLVQIRQLGDEQKSCEQLRSEMYFIENEISRLLPKSDKTGKNIALGATGILFIVPLFFMDLKQGEKKEIEAYRSRYNHLSMITHQMDCKLPSIIVKDATEENKPVIAVATSQFKKCANCEQVMGNLEKPFTFNENVVCMDCYDRLTAQADSK